MKRHTVGEVMTRDVVAVDESMGYKELVELLARHTVGAVPVVDRSRRVVGVVSDADLLHKVEFAGLEPHVELLARKHERLARTKAHADFARDLMTRPAITVSAQLSVAGAAKLMDKRCLKRLPVVDEQDRLVGIVTRADLLRPFLRPDREILDEIRNEVIVRTLWMDPDEVRLGVDEGIVTIEGEVERRTMVPIIAGLVRSVAGVVDVIDALTFRYDDTAARPTTPIIA